MPLEIKFAKFSNDPGFLRKSTPVDISHVSPNSAPFLHQQRTTGEKFDTLGSRINATFRNFFRPALEKNLDKLSGQLKVIQLENDDEKSKFFVKQQLANIKTKLDKLAPKMDGTEYRQGRITLEVDNPILEKKLDIYDKIAPKLRLQIAEIEKQISGAR